MIKGDVVWVWWNVGKTHGRRVYLEEVIYNFSGEPERIEYKYHPDDDFTVTSGGCGWSKLNCVKYREPEKEPDFDITETGEKQYKMF